jgi:hypothetical protein
MKYVLNNLITQLNKMNKKNVSPKSIMKQISEHLNTV